MIFCAPRDEDLQVGRSLKVTLRPAVVFQWWPTAIPLGEAVTMWLAQTGLVMTDHEAAVMQAVQEYSAQLRDQAVASYHRPDAEQVIEMCLAMAYVVSKVTPEHLPRFVEQYPELTAYLEQYAQASGKGWLTPCSDVFSGSGETLSAGEHIEA